MVVPVQEPITAPIQESHHHSKMASDAIGLILEHRERAFLFLVADIGLLIIALLYILSKLICLHRIVANATL